MGSRGPVPKRSNERVRRNLDSRPDQVRASGPVRIPAASKEWHRDARAWYRSLRESGQSYYYEPSDWRQAHVLATLLSRLLNFAIDSKQEPAAWKAWIAGAQELGSTEASRRRMRIEVERTGGDEREDESVPSIESYRRRAASG